MNKAAVINTRIEPELKTKAEEILAKIGLTSAEAIRIFYKQVCLNKGLPFEVKIPNRKTRNAMRDAESGKTHKAENVRDIFDELD